MKKLITALISLSLIANTANAAQAHPGRQSDLERAMQESLELHRQQEALRRFARPAARPVIDAELQRVLAESKISADREIAQRLQREEDEKGRAAVQAPKSAPARPSVSASSSASASAKPAVPVEAQPCVACGDDNARLLSCNHASLCDGCLKEHIATALQDNKNVTCPHIVKGNQKCGRELAEREVREFIRHNAALTKNYDRILQTSAQAAVANIPGIKICPTPSCGAMFEFIGAAGKHVGCGKCHKNYCGSCLINHPGISCQAARATKVVKAKPEDAATAAMLERNTKKCPQCKNGIQKTSGCNHIECGNCQYEFCWLCLLKYKDRHHCKSKDIQAANKLYPKYNPDQPDDGDSSDSDLD